MMIQEPIFDSSWPKRGYRNQPLTINNNRESIFIHSDRYGGKAMKQPESDTSEFTDADLDALADAGEYYPEESDFY